MHPAHANPPFTLDELAKVVGAQVSGDGGLSIHGVATLAHAHGSDISFLANSRYRPQLAATRAGAVIVSPESVADCPRAALVCEQPYAAYAKVAALFDPRPAAQPGIHPSAVVSEEAQVHESAHVGANAVIEAGASVACGAVVGPGSYLGADCKLGSDSRLVARVSLMHGVNIGARVLIHPGAVIGADGFGLAQEDGHWLKVPQLGTVVIGDDCEIGANTTIDRGSLDDTLLGNDVRLDNQIQIAHNVRIGAHTAMAGCSAVAGSTRIGRNCMVGGGAGILGHLEIADDVVITAMSLVSHSIREAGQYSSSTPLQDSASWRKNAVRLKQLDELARRLRALERTSR